MKGHIRLLCVAVLIALAPVARAQAAGEVDSQVGTMDATAANRGQARVANRIATSFDALAGSHDNSLALVNGLRNGTPITLTSEAPADPAATSTGGTTGTTTTTTATTTITPPTGRMGWGNVFISLALAKAALANAGITDPTAAQLQAALTGGDATLADGSTVTMKGVLEMRAEGMGWGQIAHAEGTKLGTVVSSIKSAHRTVAAMPASGATGAATSKSLVTASGSSVTTHGHKGIVTANGGSGTLGNAHGSKGIVSASGSAASAGPRGIVTAEGAAGGASSHGRAYGRGVVTAAGGGTAGLVATAGSAGRGAGVVTASGAAAASASGVTTAHGSGNAHGHGRGKGGG
jgi:hypothetical protein